MLPLPTVQSQIVDEFGRINRPWDQYLQQFTQVPPKFNQLEFSVSPYTFEGAEPGFLFITDGAVSSIILNRGSIFIDLTGEKIIPIGIKDRVIITYSVAPTLTFSASYGNAPAYGYIK